MGPNGYRFLLDKSGRNLSRAGWSWRVLGIDGSGLRDGGNLGVSSDPTTDHDTNTSAVAAWRRCSGCGSGAVNGGT